MAGDKSIFDVIEKECIEDAFSQVLEAWDRAKPRYEKLRMLDVWTAQRSKFLATREKVLKL